MAAACLHSLGPLLMRPACALATVAVQSRTLPVANDTSSNYPFCSTILNSNSTATFQAHNVASMREPIVMLLLATTRRAWDLAEPVAPRTAPVASQARWPRTFDTDGLHVVLYRPQIMRWSGDRIKGRAALAVSAADGLRAYGVAYFSGRAEIDKANELVLLSQIGIGPVDIPSDSELARHIACVLAAHLPAASMDVPVDQLQTSYAAARGFARAKLKAVSKRRFKIWIRDVTSGYLAERVELPNQ